MPDNLALLETNFSEAWMIQYVDILDGVFDAFYPILRLLC